MIAHLLHPVEVSFTGTRAEMRNVSQHVALVELKCLSSLPGFGLFAREKAKTGS